MNYAIMWGLSYLAVLDAHKVANYLSDSDSSEQADAANYAVRNGIVFG